MELSLNLESGTCVSIKEAVCSAAASLNLSGVSEVSLQGWGSSRSTVVEGNLCNIILWSSICSYGNAGKFKYTYVQVYYSLFLSLSLSVAIFLPRHTMLIYVFVCGKSVSTNVI